MISYDDGCRLLKNIQEKIYIKYRHIKYFSLMILNKYFNKKFCD
jgi:hypothetical protein